ncbi:S8 family serine peptidase [Streptomyces sp. SBT349]|uniref:S8 family serine peptidase n=1 Tax=Streptomyces sp. SBT349 TaxID=1580539 RepID=UPI00131B9891|nr:S8 family serine peptidase [Streptomyces sp. SBT349]
METLRVEEMWGRTTGEGITVAVLDTGVDASLPHLEGQVLDGTDLTIGGDGPHIDTHGHGTMMAGLIGGTGEGGGVYGIAPGVRILPVKVDNGLSFDFGQEDRWAEAIDYAVESGAQIISFSIGKQWAGHVDRLQSAIANAVRNDVLIFAATGNAGEEGNEPARPSDQAGVVGVGATDRNGDHVIYSTYGPQVALSAPGAEVPGRCPDESWETACLTEWGGTSAAAALASASAALIWSAHPDWTKNQVLRTLMETADGPGDGQRDDYVGYGMIRPDRVILDGEGRPGDPGTSPLFPTYEGTLDPPVSPEPVPEEESEEAASGEAAQEPGGEAAASGSGSGGGSATALIGVAVGVVILGGVVAAAVVSRRRTA